MNVRAGILAALLAGGMVTSAPAVARASEPNAAQMERARQLFREGIGRYEVGDWPGAERKFQESFDVRPSYDTAINLGDVELKLGQNVEAAEHLTFAAGSFPTSGKVALRRQLEAARAEALSRVGVLRIVVNVAGAGVRVGDRTLGESPLPAGAFVAPGNHVVSVTLAGYVPARQEIEVAASRTETVTFELQPLTTPQGGGSTLAIGLMIGGGVVTAAGVAMGVAGTVLSNEAAGEGNRLRAELGDLDCRGSEVDGCLRLRALEGDRVADGNLAIGGYVVAGAGLATLATGAILLLARPSASHTTVAPAVGPSGAGLHLFHRF